LNVFRTQAVGSDLLLFLLMQDSVLDLAFVLRVSCALFQLQRIRWSRWDFDSEFAKALNSWKSSSRRREN